MNHHEPCISRCISLFFPWWFPGLSRSFQVFPGAHGDRITPACCGAVTGGAVGYSQEVRGALAEVQVPDVPFADLGKPWKTWHLWHGSHEHLLNLEASWGNGGNVTPMNWKSGFDANEYEIVWVSKRNMSIRSFISRWNAGSEQEWSQVALLQSPVVLS